MVVDRFTGAVRFALRDVLLNLRSIAANSKSRCYLWYGSAGATAAALRLAGNHKIVTFLDDNPVLRSRSINGVVIQPPDVLMDLIGSIDQVLLAILL